MLQCPVGNVRCVSSRPGFLPYGRAGFVADAEEQARPWLEALLETAMFHAFVHERLAMDPDDFEVGLRLWAIWAVCGQCVGNVWVVCGQCVCNVWVVCGR